jgi:hypothetical protein
LYFLMYFDPINSNMKKSFLILLALALICGNKQLIAQKADSALAILSAQYPSEKIHIHYDKEYYVAGETIWFKAYLFSEGKPSGLSNNFYLQLVNSNGKLVCEKKFPVLGASVRGSIALPDSLPAATYYIRALTPGILSEGEDFVYKKNIFVSNPSSPAVAKPAQTVSLQFFPESGKLVDGILTVVGFKATDQWGAPIEVEGILKMEDGTTIASFKSYHAGIGKVQFKPQVGKKYIAEVETGSGKRTYPLPVVDAAGINLRIQDEKGGKKFQLSRSTKDKEQYDELVILAEMNNHVVYETSIAFEDYPSVIGHLITDSLPSGILHFTIFNKDGAPLAERLSFVDNGEYKAAATINLLKTDIDKRAEDSIEVMFPNPIQRSCSIAVIDQSGQSLGDNDNIWSRFLLTSDLKGHINNPAWYFENQGDTVKQALDNLMLTHGWSRFNWTKILSGQYRAKRNTDNNLITIAGKVIDEKTKEPLSGGKINFILEMSDSSSQNFDTPVNTDGSFALDSMFFFGKAKFFYAYIDKQSKPRPALLLLNDNVQDKILGAVPTDIIQSLTPGNPFISMSKVELDIRMKAVRSKLEEVKELQNVDIKTKSNKKPIDIVNEKYTTGVFRAPGKVDIDNINEPATDKSMNVIDFVKNRIQQLELQNGIFVNRKNISLMSGQKWPVGIFVNEIPADINQLRILRADNVALVKFYEAGFVGVGSGSPGGALAIYTKEKSSEYKPEKLSFVEYNGYSITKEFYKPDYSGDGKNHKELDNRTTLYWNPDVFTDAETQSVKFNFYNNDFSRKLKIVVEGFDATGKLIHLEKVIGN